MIKFTILSMYTCSGRCAAHRNCSRLGKLTPHRRDKVEILQFVLFVTPPLCQDQRCLLASQRNNKHTYIKSILHPDLLHTCGGHMVQRMVISWNWFERSQFIHHHPITRLTPAHTSQHKYGSGDLMILFLIEEPSSGPQDMGTRYTK